MLVNAPLTGATAEAPDYRGHTPLVFYRPGEWKRELIGEQNEGVVHGLCVTDWDGDGRDQILTAAMSGIALHKYNKNGTWTRTEIAQGDPAPWPKSGASDLAVGSLRGQKFIASIEPWHGNQTVIYRQEKGKWARQVIDSALVDGHTVQVGDFDGDGTDEVIAGYRGGDHSLILYQADKSGKKWSRTVLDRGGMGAAACAVADLNGDGKADIACIGSATANLKWYENRTAR